MNILIIARGIPSTQYPLNGIFEFDQAKALVKKGFSVTYFAIDLRSIRRLRKFGQFHEERDGVDCYSYNIPIGAIPDAPLLKIGEKAIKRLYIKKYKNKKPDIVHAHFTEYGYMSVSLCSKYHIPLVITEHSSEINKQVLDQKKLQIAQYAYEKAQLVISVGDKLRQSIKEKTGVSSIVIPNIVNAETFYKDGKKDCGGVFGFVFTGNLINRKRPLLLIDAFYEIQKKYGNVKLGIIGDGILKEEIKAKIDLLAIGNKVKLYGMIERSKMASIYAEYDCFVLPTERETFGVVYIEAMAAGLPVIATYSGGPEDFVIPKVGILIHVDDRKALVDAMEYMIINSRVYKSDEIREYVKEHFSGDVISDKLAVAYRGVLLQKAL